VAEPAVTENPEEERYELRDGDGELLGFLEYRGRREVRALTHTEVLPEAEGKGAGSQLVAGVLDDLRGRGMQLIPICPFVKAYLERHPEQLDLVEPRIRRSFGLPEPPG
jgi:uncharacterized protein